VIVEVKIGINEDDGDDDTVIADNKFCLQCFATVSWASGNASGL